MCWATAGACACAAAGASVCPLLPAPNALAPCARAPRRRAGPGTLVLSDALNHTSIVAGVKASGAAVKVFRHNNVRHLESLLRFHIAEGQPRTHRPWKKVGGGRGVCAFGVCGGAAGSGARCTPPARRGC